MWGTGIRFFLKDFGATGGPKKLFLGPPNRRRFFQKTVFLGPRNHCLGPRETRKLGSPQDFSHLSVGFSGAFQNVLVLLYRSPICKNFAPAARYKLFSLKSIYLGIILTIILVNTITFRACGALKVVLVTFDHPFGGHRCPQNRPYKIWSTFWQK